MSGIYYNEFEPSAAAWLRELMREGLIPFGDVDERSIEDVTPQDVAGYTQCHFFAGIGGWPLALRLAGVRDDEPMWTGSCPCQPFSAAGAGRGVDDPRHLWPAFRWLIDQCRPAATAGEQVASKAGREWLAGVRADLEAMGYGVGAVDLCAAGVGAPHIRQRLWWVAQYDRRQRDGIASSEGRKSDGPQTGRLQSHGQFEHGGAGSGLADGNRPGSLLSQRRGSAQESEQPAPQRHDADGCGAVRRLGNTDRCDEGAECRAARGAGAEPRGSSGGLGDTNLEGPQGRRVLSERSDELSPWAASLDNWLPCADGKARRIEPGIEPLVDGLSGRVGLLRGYGNAIVPQVAAEVIRAWLDQRGTECCA